MYPHQQQTRKHVLPWKVQAKHGVFIWPILRVFKPCMFVLWVNSNLFLMPKASYLLIWCEVGCPRELFWQKGSTCVDFFALFLNLYGLFWFSGIKFLWRWSLNIQFLEIGRGNLDVCVCYAPGKNQNCTFTQEEQKLCIWITLDCCCEQILWRISQL